MLSKKTKKQAQELIAIAYERDLKFHLNQLSLKFDEWRNHTIDSWDLNEEIHKFHYGISRDLYKIYNLRNMEIFLLKQALSKGLIHESEIPKELYELVQK